MVNEVTKLLGIKYPIIQGAMNWLTDANFVAAVSKAGALGILDRMLAKLWLPMIHKF